jgi:putative hemolysin
MIFLVYDTLSASAQQLGSDQPCSSSYPCQKICGNHVCGPGEVPGAPQTNQTATQNAITTNTMTNQTAIQKTTIPMVSQQFKFSTKGQISNSSGIAPGTVVWTILNGNNATFVYHAIKGLAVIRLATSPDPVCNNAQSQICLDGKITQLKDPDQVFSIGEESKINIQPIQKQETVGFVTGPLQNILLQIDLTKIWTYNNVNTMNTNTTTLANPASVYCVNHGGTLLMKTGPAGQYGMCTFSNGSQCEEWQYFRGQCNPTQPPMNSTSMNSTSNTTTAGSNSTNSTSK